ncbi:uncharacterized protein LOC115456161 isoform X2 [Manduca sexta]|uniref:uncharacterized protein LOC115456161 isoform X2 n=1 Tax=Manduca sexta TaxID=7130 RepID=UPI00188F31F4|nr:uncharacterized protein LOC115456161 isoform X2 [Manduca sexta]
MSTEYDQHIKIKLEPETDHQLDSENGITQSADDIVNQKPEFVNIKMEIDIENNVSNIKQEFKQPPCPDSTSAPSSPAPGTMVKMEYEDPIDSMNNEVYYTNEENLNDQHQETYNSSYLVPAMMQPNTSQCYFDNGKIPLNKPCAYKKKIGRRMYQNYTEEKLQKAIKDIQENRISLRDAQVKYNIHRNTLHNKIKGKHSGAKPGRPTIFSPEEENELVEHAVTVSSYGFPVTRYDLRSIAQTYLKKLGRNVSHFKENLPGTDWVNKFIKRHKSVLSHRIAKKNNVRPATDAGVANNFFDHLVKELKDVPAANIWNYDEINLVDDPGLKKVITRRNCKYPEVIKNSTKGCVSIMIAGNAAGDIIPMYVNYKSQKLQQTWTTGGPEGARYNCSKSSWFDTQGFEDWFMHLMLPVLKKQVGKKVLIGDNFSSHLNFEVVKACEDNNSSFVCLPTKAGHLCQPLDFAYYGPMIVSWRNILSEWKDTSRGSRFSTIPKVHFPRLLKKLFEVLEPNRENLISGFRECGISPIDRTIILGHKSTLKTITKEADREHISADLEVGEQSPTAIKRAGSFSAKNSEEKHQSLPVVRSHSPSETEDNFSLRDISGNTYNENMAPYKLKSSKLRDMLNDIDSSSDEDSNTYKEKDYVIVD